MYDYEDATKYVIEQYKSSRNFIGYLNSMISQYTEISKVATEIDTNRRLNTAIGQNLDDLGDIIGYQRPLAQDVSRFFSFFGGDGRGFTNTAGTVLGGEWITLQGAEGAPISDTIYRDMLKLKVKVNQSKGTPDEVIDAVFEFTGTYPILTEGTASITLEIIGASSIGIRDFYANFLPRPIGVSLIIEDLPLLGDSIVVGNYIGTGVSQKIPYSIADFKVIGAMIWIKSRDGSGDFVVYADVMGKGDTFASNNTDPSQNTDISLIETDGFTVTGAHVDTNAIGTEYEYFILPMTNRESLYIEETGRSVDWFSNAFTGFSFAKYRGSGSKQGLPLPSKSSMTMVSFRDYKNGSDFTAYSFVAPVGIDINTDQPAHPDEYGPIIGADFITVENKFNDLDTDYFMWGLSRGAGYITISSYVGNGTAGRLISVGVQPILAMVRRVDGVGNWVFITTDLPVGNTLAMNLKDGLDTTDKITLDPLGFTVSDDADVNVDGASYLYMVIKQ